MAFHPVEWVKHHPYEAGGIVLVVLGALFLITRSSSSSSTNTTAYNPQTDPAVVNAEIAAQSQQDAINGQIADHLNQINGQIQLANAAGGTQVALANIQASTQGQAIAAQAHTSDLQSALAYELGVAQVGFQTTAASLQADTANRSIAASEAVQEAQLSTEQNIASIVNNAAVTENQQNNMTTQYVSAVNGQTQQYISQNQSQVAIEQTRAAVEIAKANQQGGIFKSLIGAVGSVAGALIG